MRSLSVRTSRRVVALKDSDYDHEIGLVDQDQASHPGKAHPSASSSAASGTSTDADGVGRRSSEPLPEEPEEEEGTQEELQRQQHILRRPDSRAEDIGREDHYHDARDAITPRQSHTLDDAERVESNPSGSGSSQDDGNQLEERDTTQTGPPIEVEGPTPYEHGAPAPNGTPQRPESRRRQGPESAIDILWENERGCFFCGTALFSAAALGNLDPSPWTNQYHKTSPTNVRTAQVPDPSWEWAWPEWRINREEGAVLDEFGWEYSFMFSRKFSWHGPKWWNSFVRRRAWIRKRIKKKPEDVPSDPHMLNTDYFNVTPARTRTSSVGSWNSRPGDHLSARDSRSSMRSKGSTSQISKGESIVEERPDITDIWMLMSALRAARIDREKIEAVENYLEHTEDRLEGLEDQVHEIMGIFIFQASRRILLSRLTQVYDHMTTMEKSDPTGTVGEKRLHLQEAITHADEEIKRLAYWSDIKKVAESGDAAAELVADEEFLKGEGLDRSGPAHANEGKLP